jgi:DNA-binding transcriptional ArsR family regulator
MKKVKESPVISISENLEALKAIAHPLRLQIIGFIHENTEVNVNKIYNTLNLEQSITSQHLKIMRNAGVVLSRKDERYVFYSLNYQMLSQIGTALIALSPTNEV